MILVLKAIYNKISRALVASFAIACIFLLVSNPYSNVQAQNVDDQARPITRILFLLDGSSSMYSLWENNNRIDLAKKAIIGIIDSMKGNDEVEFALRVYGHQSPEHMRDCNDTKLEVPFGKNNEDQIKARLRTIKPKGTTPIAKSLEAATHDFSDSSDSRNIIILITDGIESCDGDPCAISLSMQQKNIIIKPFVIGIALSESYSAKMECIGSYYNAKGEASFLNALKRAVHISLTSTTAQVNLLDIKKGATETDVNMTFYDNFSGAIKYNLYHTLNQRGVPDTFYIDPINTYNIVMHSIPPVRIDNAECKYDVHNIFSTSSPQGHLELQMQGITAKSAIRGQIKCIVRQAGKEEVINVQDFNTRIKYLVGKYDLEILTLPRIIMKNVEVSQSKTTAVQIPGSGLVNITSRITGYGGIFRSEGEELTKIYAFKENMYRELLAMQPGTYKVIFRKKNAKKSSTTIEKIFKVSSNRSVSVNLD